MAGLLSSYYCNSLACFCPRQCAKVKHFLLVQALLTLEYYRSVESGFFGVVVEIELVEAGFEPMPTIFLLQSAFIHSQV